MAADPFDTVAHIRVGDRYDFVNGTTGERREYRVVIPGGAQPTELVRVDGAGGVAKVWHDWLDGRHCGVRGAGSKWERIS